MPKHFLIRSLIFISLVGLSKGCQTNDNSPAESLSIIPMPVSMRTISGQFEISNSTKILINPQSAELTRMANMLAKEFDPFIDSSMAIDSASAEMGNGNIYLSVTTDPQLGDEGYELSITSGLMTVTANKPAGLYRGIQTIRQIIHTRSLDESQSELNLPNCLIRDYPEFEYRGAMLDVARHFFSVEDVKRFIDFLALYKMNALHLGLTNDQGWRIEIKSWPKLTEIGGTTEVGGGEGGFYTQVQYRDIVQYASDRHIMIIPEIDMPGHNNAALASYPELNADGKATELYTGTDVGFSTLDTHKEITYEFIDDVIREIAEMTPGKYIHIGGDESHVTDLEDYIPFINRAQKIVQSHGKQAIGWDEIANASLDSSSVIQYWANSKNAVKGIDQNAKIIMSPAAFAYLDMQYDSTTKLGLNWASYIEVDRGYAWAPSKLDSAIQREHILGIEACLWTETITNMEELEYMVFPRLPGYAEIGWSQPEKQDWEEYKIRLATHRSYWEALGINFYPSKLVPWN